MARRGLRDLIHESPHLTVSGETPSADQVRDLVGRLRTGVLIVDAVGLDREWMETIRRARTSAPSTEILVFSARQNEALIRAPIAAGARGFVLKSEPEEVLLAAVDALSRHQPYFSSVVSQTIVKAFARSPGVPGGALANFGLSARENEVLAMLAEGKSNRIVAAHLRISVRTVRAHPTRIMRKLGASSVAELMRYTVRMKMIDP